MRFLHVFFLGLFLIASCNNEEKNNLNSSEPVNVTDTLFIDNSKINFSVRYEIDGVEIKDPLRKDTIMMFVDYVKEFKKAISGNEIRIESNVDHCQVRKITNDQFRIIFDKKYNNPLFKCTLYLIPIRNSVYDINRKIYYKPYSKITIAEKLNTVDL